jgi:acetyl-CoA C-acetyltransferase
MRHEGACASGPEAAAVQVAAAYVGHETENPGVLWPSDRWLRANPGYAPRARIIGWGHRTVGLSLASKLDRPRTSPDLMPHVRDAIEAAFRRAAIEGVRQLDCIETHDCMTPSGCATRRHPQHRWEHGDDGELHRRAKRDMRQSE